MSTISRKERKRLVKERYLSRKTARDNKFNTLKDIVDDTSRGTIPRYQDYDNVYCDKHCDICIDNIFAELDDNTDIIHHECPITEKFKKKHGVYPDPLLEFKNRFKYDLTGLSCICYNKRASDRPSKKIFSTIKKDTIANTRGKGLHIVYETRDVYVYKRSKLVKYYDPRTCSFSKGFEYSGIDKGTFRCAYCLSKHVPDLRIVDNRRDQVY